MGAPFTPYPGAAQKVAVGGTSVAALYGPMQGGILYNPSTAKDQNILNYSSYVVNTINFPIGIFGRYGGFNSLYKIPFNGFTIISQNVSIVGTNTPEILYYSLIGPAQLSEGNGTFALYPGETFNVPAGCGTNVWVNAATSGHRFTAIAIQPATQYPPTPIPTDFPPSGPVTALQTLLAYLYKQYQDDDDLWAFIYAYNNYTQLFIDWFNSVNLPIYPGLSGPLLDWVGQGLYGYARPTLFSNSYNAIGPFNTYGFNSSVGFNSFKIVDNITNVAITTDDIYQRCLTWHLYKGDGKNLSAYWMKRRTARFLYGAAGGDYDGTHYNISISVTQSTMVITVVSGFVAVTGGTLFNRFGFNSGLGYNSILTQTTPVQVPATAFPFVEAINTGALETPAQFQTTARIGEIGGPLP